MLPRSSVRSCGASADAATLLNAGRRSWTGSQMSEGSSHCNAAVWVNQPDAKSARCMHPAGRNSAAQGSGSASVSSQKKPFVPTVLTECFKTNGWCGAHDRWLTIDDSHHRRHHSRWHSRRIRAPASTPPLLPAASQAAQGCLQGDADGSPHGYVQMLTMRTRPERCS